MFQDRIVIVGAGGFGREVASWCLDSYGQEAKIAFIDDTKKGIIKIGKHEIPILSTLNSYNTIKGDQVLMGLGIPSAKKEIAKRFNERGIKFTTFIHKSVIISPGAQIGRGSIICPNSIVSDNVNLGDCVTLNLCCTVGHDVNIGEYSTLSSHVDIMGGCRIGKSVFWGSGSRIIPDKFVTDGCRIGAGALVMYDISTEKTVYSLPSKTL